MIFTIIAIAAGFVSLFAFAMSKVAGDTDYEAEMARRIKRDQELQELYWAFLSVEGRAPTAREMWEISPPEFTDDPHN